MNRNMLYLWVVTAIAALVLATVVPWIIVNRQTKDLKDFARDALCVSVAEQNRNHPTFPIIRTENSCHDLNTQQILDLFQRGIENP
jgi:hypothetical protein